MIYFFFALCYNIVVGEKPKNKINFHFKRLPRFFWAAVIFCAIFSSCQNKTEMHFDEKTELAKEIEDVKNNTTWTYELEGERLSKKISSVTAIAKDIPLTPSALVALEGGAAYPGIFPEMEGFTSLDTSSIKGEIFDTVNSFCYALMKYVNAPPPEPKKENAEEEKDSKETKEGAGDLKEKPKEDDSKEIPEKDSSIIDNFFAPETLFSLVLFLEDSSDAGKLQSFIIGNSFIGDETIEVPVRFTYSDKILYTFIYPVFQSEKWEIHQIEIYKVEEKNGSK